MRVPPSSSPVQRVDHRSHCFVLYYCPPTARSTMAHALRQPSLRRIPGPVLFCCFQCWNRGSQPLTHSGHPYLSSSPYIYAISRRLSLSRARTSILLCGQWSGRPALNSLLAGHTTRGAQLPRFSTSAHSDTRRIILVPSESQSCATSTAPRMLRSSRHDQRTRSGR